MSKYPSNYQRFRKGSPSRVDSFKKPMQVEKLSSKMTEQTHRTISLLIEKIRDLDDLHIILQSVSAALLDQYNQGLIEGWRGEHDNT